jgi:hypothetical protein
LKSNYGWGHKKSTVVVAVAQGEVVMNCGFMTYSRKNDWITSGPLNDVYNSVQGVNQLESRFTM